jgi:ABC-2 type transport system permease protein
VSESRIWPVAQGVAWRTVKNVVTTPSILLPSLLFPLFMFTAFAGGLSQVENLPGFGFEGGYTTFQFVFVLLQSAAFGGVFTGFGVARDFEGGFARRLLLASPKRSGIVLGYALAAFIRWAIVAVLITVVALLVGTEVSGSPTELLAMDIVLTAWSNQRLARHYRRELRTVKRRLVVLKKQKDERRKETTS